ncbi:hypothetical protein [Oceaniglobus roseus]|uniref:hypothetical protein n=1 Tax=Oceaniglobus roseus TaxID=1737570 RepID=UPI000C7EA69B|nr:hypothetical protein [Kandeliimicrobium roseum]
MSDYFDQHCTCATDQRPPPGAGLALASLVGLGGVILAILVWSLTGAWLWALIAWFFVSPACLLAKLFWDIKVNARHLSKCDNARCLFRLWPSSRNGAVNV